MTSKRRGQYNHHRIQKHATAFGKAMIGVYAPHAAAIITACEKGRRLLKDFS